MLGKVCHLSCSFVVVCFGRDFEIDCVRFPDHCFFFFFVFFFVFFVFFFFFFFFYFGIFG